MPTTLRLFPTGLGPRRADVLKGMEVVVESPHPAGESVALPAPGLHAVFFDRPARHRPPMSGSPLMVADRRYLLTWTLCAAFVRGAGSVIILQSE